MRKEGGGVLPKGARAGPHCKGGQPGSTRGREEGCYCRGRGQVCKRRPAKGTVCQGTHCGVEGQAGSARGREVQW